MKIVRNIIVAFALYSQIPMPIFEWKKEDMEYTIAFLPLIGAVIGALEFWAVQSVLFMKLPPCARIAVFAAVPLLVTGGFHVDGFMDVVDAFKSLKSKEEKIMILKDPHIGAFAVIGLVVYACFFCMAGSVLFDNAIDKKSLLFIALGFYEIRALAAFLSIKLRHAKKDGMLHEETKMASIKTKLFIAFEIIIGAVLMLYFSVKCFAVAFLLLLLFSIYYRNKVYKEFGGVTGDTAGYFIMVGELLIMLSVAIVLIL